MVDRFREKQQAAFTIVELIVVIAAISVLATIVVLSYGPWRNTIATNSVKSDLTHAAATMESARGFSGNSTGASGTVSGYPTAIPSSFSASQTNTITLTAVDPLSYCIDGTTSVDSTIKYYIDSLTQSNGPTQGTCATRTTLPTPGVVTNLAATTTASEVDLTWTLASPNYATTHTAQCSQDPAFITNVISASVSGTATSAAVKNATLATTYYCRVRGENSNGAGQWSSSISAVTQSS